MPRNEPALKLKEYTQVPNFFFDDLLPVLPDWCLRVLLFIWRKTVGWNKSADFISLSQIEKGARVSHRHAWEAADLLVRAEIFSRQKSGTRGMSRFIVNAQLDRQEAVRRLTQLLVPQRNQFPQGTSSPQELKAVPHGNFTGSSGEHTEIQPNKRHSVQETIPPTPNGIVESER